MSHFAHITRLALGQVRTIDDAAKALNDVELFGNNLRDMFIDVMRYEHSAGQFRLIVIDEDGGIRPYKFIAGTGTTIVFDSVLQTCTITSP